MNTNENGEMSLSKGKAQEREFRGENQLTGAQESRIEQIIPTPVEGDANVDGEVKAQFSWKEPLRGQGKFDSQFGQV